jgi:hypothetical protein
MAISSITNVDTGEITLSVISNKTFVDAKDAAKLAEDYASYLGGDDVYVVEAISKYSVPSPVVVKQNLHIPPLTPRGESNE